MSADKKTRPDLQGWIKRVSDREMPIFGRTVQEVISVSQESETSASQMAQAILRDSAMTAKVLRLANSSFYNPARNAISTISRAVVVLGFDVVRSMCLSIALMDSLVSGERREQVIQEMARSLHAAVQARTLAQERHDRSPEEVFIAALLYRLGDMAFLCSGGEYAEALLAAQTRDGLTREQAEQQVLGFPLKRLTLGLSREWRLNELLEQTLTATAPGKRGQSIELTHQLALAAEEGWDSAAATKAIRALAELADMPPEQMQTLVQEGASQAASIAARFGAARAARFIPQPSHHAAEAEPEEKEVEKDAFPKADAMLQLRILREVAGLLTQNTDVNLLLEVVLEGIYRGVGTDRAVFALLSPDRHQLRAKYALGWRQADLIARFRFPLGDTAVNVFDRIIRNEDAALVDAQKQREWAPLLTPVVVDRLGEAPFLAAPCVVEGKCIGVFFADRAASGRRLDQEAFESFAHFVGEANRGLEHLTRRRRSR